MPLLQDQERFLPTPSPPLSHVGVEGCGSSITSVGTLGSAAAGGYKRGSSSCYPVDEGYGDDDAEEEGGGREVDGDDLVNILQNLNLQADNKTISSMSNGTRMDKSKDRTSSLSTYEGHEEVAALSKLVFATMDDALNEFANDENSSFDDNHYNKISNSFVDDIVEDGSDDGRSMSASASIKMKLKADQRKSLFESRPMSTIDDSSLKISRTVTSITSPISDVNEALPKDLREASNEKRVSALSYPESDEIDKTVDLSSSLNVNQTSVAKDVVNSTAPQSCTDKGTNDTYFTDSEYFPISPRSASSLESQRSYHDEDDLSYSLNLSSLNSSFEKDSIILSPTDCKMSTPATAKSTVEKGTIASIFPGKRTNKVTPCPVILENEFSAVSQFGTNSREGFSTDATNNISSNMRKNSITFNELRVSTTIAKFDFLAKQLRVESKTSENVQDDLQGFRYDKDAPGKVSCCSASTLR